MKCGVVSIAEGEENRLCYYNLDIKEVDIREEEINSINDFKKYLIGNHKFIISKKQQQKLIDTGSFHLLKLCPETFDISKICFGFNKWYPVIVKKDIAEGEEK